MSKLTVTSREMEALRQAIFVTLQVAALLPGEFPQEGTRDIAKDAVRFGTLTKCATKLCKATEAAKGR